MKDSHAQKHSTKDASDAEVDPGVEFLDLQRSRHLKRMTVLFLGGLCMPVLFGFGNEFLMRLFDLTWVGMDAYLPFMLGLSVGLLVGVGVGIAGLVQLVAAIRCWRHRARLIA